MVSLQAQHLPVFIGSADGQSRVRIYFHNHIIQCLTGHVTDHMSIVARVDVDVIHTHICYKRDYINAWLFEWVMLLTTHLLLGVLCLWSVQCDGDVKFHTDIWVHAGMFEHPVGDHTYLVSIDCGRPREMSFVPLPYMCLCRYVLNRQLLTTYLLSGVLCGRPSVMMFIL